MPAFDHLNKYLFDEMYEGMHGLSVSEALSGHVAKISGIGKRRFYSPEEYDEIMGVWEKQRKPYKEIHSKQTGPTDVEQTIRRYQMVNPVEAFLAGDELNVAAELRDLTNVMRQKSRLNEVTLYRGAHREPAVDAGKTRPLGFTPDVNSVKHYTSDGWDGRGRAPIWKAKPGTVRGIPLSEIGGRPMTVGRTRRRDNEWFVLPESVPEKWPEK